MLIIGLKTQFVNPLHVCPSAQANFVCFYKASGQEYHYSVLTVWTKVRADNSLDLTRLRSNLFVNVINT